MYLSVWSYFLALNVPPEIVPAGGVRKGFETCEGHLGKVKAYIAGSCCLHIIGEGRVSHSKKSNEQTAAGRAQPEYLPSEVSYKLTGHDLQLVIRVYTTFSPKATVTFYVPPWKSFCRQAGTSSAGPVSHRELHGTRPEPAGDGDAGLAGENKPWSSALWQDCIVATQLSFWIRCTFKCFQPNQGSQVTSYKLSGWFTLVGKTQFNR